MAATTRLVPPEKRGMATGIVNAGGSFGQFVFAPIAQRLTAAPAGPARCRAGGLIVLLALPAAWVLRGNSARRRAARRSPAAPQARERARGDPARLHDPSYLLLCAGFFVCGFHVAFLATHLPGVVAACRLPPAVGALGAGDVGLFNIVGSLAIGWASAAGA